MHEVHSLDIPSTSPLVWWAKFVSKIATHPGLKAMSEGDLFLLEAASELSESMATSDGLYFLINTLVGSYFLRLILILWTSLDILKTFALLTWARRWCHSYIHLFSLTRYIRQSCLLMAITLADMAWLHTARSNVKRFRYLLTFTTTLPFLIKVINVWLSW